MIRTRLIMIAAFFLFFAGTNEKGGYTIGDSVEDFELKDVSGDMISLSDFTDSKGFIVVFDCNTCPYSQAYRERIKDLHSKYADKGYPVIAIQPNAPEKSPGDSYDNMQKYAKKHNYDHHYLFDETQEVTKQFGATNTPHVYVLNKEGGEHIVTYIGAIDNNTRDGAAADKKYVESAVDALLEGQKPKTKETKAIGCTIKWKSA